MLLRSHNTVVRSPNSYTSRKEGENKHNSLWLRSVKRKCEASLWKESIECEGETMEEIILPRRRSSDSPAKLVGSAQHCYTYADGRIERDLLSKMGRYSQRAPSLEEKKSPHHHHNWSFFSEDRETLDLKEALRSQIEAFNALHNELENERNASATAANETLGMILRLQEEKSAVEMETRQFKRMAEEREAHSQETIALLKEFLMEREEDILLLEEELQTHRQFLSRHGKNSSERDKYPEKLLGNNVRTPTSCLLADTSACYIFDKQFPSRYESGSCKRDGHSETLLGNNDERIATSSLLVDTSASCYISDREVSARYERSGYERDGYTETLLGNNERSMISSLADTNASHHISDRDFPTRYEMGSFERDEYSERLLDNSMRTTALCLLADTSTSRHISDRDSPRDVGLSFMEVNKWRETGSSITSEVTENATMEREGSSHSAIWERIRRLEDRLQHLGESQALLSEEGECSSHEIPSLYPDDISISSTIPERVNRYEKPNDPYYHCSEDASENSDNVYDVFEVECGVESAEHNKLSEGLQVGAEKYPSNDEEQCEMNKDLEDFDRKTMNLSPNIIGSLNPETTQNLDMLSLFQSSQPLAESMNDPDDDVQELIKRLQALESERLFMMQAIKSLRKENTELKLLEEIAQQIRELRGNVRNSTRSLNGSLQQNEFHLSSVFRGILSFVGLKSNAFGQDNRLPCRSLKCSEQLLVNHENHVGLTHLLDDPSPSVAPLCMMRELKVTFPPGTRLKA